MLKNKAGIWMSDDEWNFKTKNYYSIYIENISKTKVLGTKFDDDVVLEDFDKDKTKQQRWYKGQSDAEGYFILENKPQRLQGPKIMTAISPSNIKIKGKINSEMNS